jgi:D-amino peptidase
MRLGIFAAMLLLSAELAEGQKIKVFISIDMEGITGVVSSDQVSRSGSDYQMTRRWMTEEANAAVQGALDAGATEVVINDSHGDMRNLILADVNPAATLITGSPKPLSMMQGIDATYDAVIFIGYHAKEGTADAVLDHTISGGTVGVIRINGREMPELGMNALLAGSFNVPVVLISGDKAVCEQAKSILGEQVVTVAVKEGIGKRAAKSLPLVKAREIIRSQVKTAVEKRKDIKPFRINSPYKFEITYVRSSQADNAAVIAGVRRLDAKTLQFESGDVVEGFKFMRGLINLGRDD